MDTDQRTHRLEQAQAILTALSPAYRMGLTRGRVFLSCPISWGSGIWRKQWVSVSPGSFYPRFKSAPYQGGTWCVCVAQLVRFVQGKPHLPMGWWRQAVNVGCEPGVLAAAASVGWPAGFPCIHCGKFLQSGYDWWCVGKLEGVSCWGGECRKEKQS